MTLNKLINVKPLYLRYAVTERNIADKAAKIGVTDKLNNESRGFLPIHCITYLLSSRTFANHQIPIQVKS